MLPGVLLRPVLSLFDQGAAGFIIATSLSATATGARWHHDDAGTHRPCVRGRRSALDATRVRRRARRSWIDRRGLAVGRDERARTVRIPVGHASGRQPRSSGRQGSGKTVTRGPDGSSTRRKARS
jgi:hypothetical protein